MVKIKILFIIMGMAKMLFMNNAHPVQIEMGILYVKGLPFGNV